MNTTPTTSSPDATSTSKATTAMLFVWHLLLIWTWTGLNFGSYRSEGLQGAMLTALALLPGFLSVLSFALFVARAQRFLHPALPRGNGPEYGDLFVRTLVDLSTYTLLAMLFSMAGRLPFGDADEEVIMAAAFSLFLVFALQGLVRTILGIGPIRQYLAGKKNFIYLLVVVSAIIATLDSLGQTLRSLGSFFSQFRQGAGEEGGEELLGELFANVDPWAILALILVVISLFSLLKAVAQMKELLGDIKKLALLIYKLATKIRHLLPASSKPTA